MSNFAIQMASIVSLDPRSTARAIVGYSISRIV